MRDATSVAFYPPSHSVGVGMSTPIQNDLPSRFAERDFAPANRLPLAPPQRQHDPELVKAAQGMEALFLDYLMQVMRQSIPKNEMGMNSNAIDLYQGMLDSEMTQQVAHQQGGGQGSGSRLGLADQILNSLDPLPEPLPPTDFRARLPQAYQNQAQERQTVSKQQAAAGTAITERSDAAN